MQVKSLEDQSDAGMCYGVTRIFKDHIFEDPEEIRPGSNESHSSFLPQVLTKRPWCTSSCLWTRGATEIIGPWSAGWTWEDYEYDIRAGCHDIKIVHIPKVVCYYRRSGFTSHLSQTKKEIARYQRAESLDRIAHTLYDYGKLRSAQNQILISKILYDSGMGLLDVQAGHEAAHSFHLMRRFGLARWKLIAGLLQIVSILLPAHFAFRIVYKLRPLLFSKMRDSLLSQA